MAFFIEYDETYVAGQHKASSISSLESGDHPPSLYTTDSCSSLCDPDELKDLVFIEEQPKATPPSISIPSDFWYNPPSFTWTQKEQDSPKLKCTQVLSPDEKRVQHIASEHKRRQSIRDGLKQLTDWVPHLKHIPHNKSTILFKTADYIKRTEKRNKVLQERLLLLRHRLILSLEQQVLEQQQVLLHHQMHGSAIIVPVNDDDDNDYDYDYDTPSSIPCLNIPADEDFGRESLLREQLLSCGKLKLPLYR